MAKEKEVVKEKRKTSVTRVSSSETPAAEPNHRHTSSDRNCGKDGCSGLPEIPEIVFSEGDEGWQNVLKDRFVDLCFGAFLIFLVIMYGYQRADYDPLIGSVYLDQHPLVKKGVAMTLALILGAVARRSGEKAAAFLDTTIGMAIGLIAMSRAARPGKGGHQATE